MEPIKDKNVYDANRGNFYYQGKYQHNHHDHAQNLDEDPDEPELIEDKVEEIENELDAEHGINHIQEDDEVEKITHQLDEEDALGFREEDEDVEEIQGEFNADEGLEDKEDEEDDDISF